MSSQWALKLRKPSVRRAALNWLTRQADAGRDPAVTSRLAADWRHLARVYGDGASPGQFFAVFTALGAARDQALPPSNVVRYYLRSLRAHPTAEGWARLHRHLADEVARGRDPRSRWARELDVLRRARSARHAAAVRFEDMRDSLEVLTMVFFPELGCLVLEPEPRWVLLETLTASTDGARVLLPSSISVAEDARSNELAYVRLLFHELAHISEGSFGLTMSDLRRGRLASRLARARRDRLALPRLPSGSSPLDCVIRSFSRPHMLHGLLNVIEDVRVEAALSRRLAFFAPLERWVTSLERSHQPPPAIASAQELLLRAVSVSAAGDVVRLPIAARHRGALARVEAVFAQRPARQLSGIAEALEQAIDLYEILLPEVEADDQLRQLIEARADANDLEAARRTHDREDRDEEGRSRVDLPHRPETDLDLGVPWFDYPEWDADQQRMEPGVARVHLFGRTRPTVRSPIPDVGFAGLATSGVTRRRRARNRTEGLELDLDRTYDWMVSRRSGREADGRVFQATRRVRMPQPRTVDFVLDLSTSMGGSTARDLVPIAAARELLQLVVPRLEAQGWNVAIHGAWDHGRRSIRLYEIKAAGERLDPTALGELELRGFGGFRHGALVRHISAMAAKTNPGQPGHVVLLTDSASHYMIRGFDQSLSSSMSRQCNGCSVRHRCPVDPRRPQVEVGDGSMVLFSPTYTELDDLRHAVQLSPLRVGLVLLGPNYRPESLDRSLGPKSWWRVTTNRDVHGAVGGVQRWLTPLSR